eukprot:875064-Rhodomonas_salina.1
MSRPRRVFFLRRARYGLAWFSTQHPSNANKRHPQSGRRSSALTKADRHFADDRTSATRKSERGGSYATRHAKASSERVTRQPLCPAASMRTPERRCQPTPQG